MGKERMQVKVPKAHEVVLKVSQNQRLGVDSIMYNVVPSRRQQKATMLDL